MILWGRKRPFLLLNYPFCLPKGDRSIIGNEARAPLHLTLNPAFDLGELREMKIQIEILRLKLPLCCFRNFPRQINSVGISIINLIICVPFNAVHISLILQLLDISKLLAVFIYLFIYTHPLKYNKIVFLASDFSCCGLLTGKHCIFIYLTSGVFHFLYQIQSSVQYH